MQSSVSQCQDVLNLLTKNNAYTFVLYKDDDLDIFFGGCCKYNQIAKVVVIVMVVVVERVSG